MIDRLSERLHKRDIQDICAACVNESDNSLKEELFSLVRHENDRVGYNALWVFTHFPGDSIKWLEPKHNELIDILLKEEHTGKRRLILTLLERQPVNIEEIRTDYLDFCLSKINSTEPYAIRALSLKQAYAMCRHYPELLEELRLEMDMMTRGELSPGLLSALRHIRRHLTKH